MSKRPVILTIDDEKSIRESLRCILEYWRYQVIEAENGRVGMERFEKEHPDLVLLDLIMPEMDGREVLSKITAQYPDTPVIIISGTGMIRDAVEALRLGAWHYLFKPIEDMTVLIHAVEQALERARLIKENRAYQNHLEQEVTRRTEELKDANDKLHRSIEKLKRNAAALKQQKATLELQKAEIEAARTLLEEKNLRLELSNKYKTEFLANMSHELRTPLNSIILLSKLLSENKDGVLKKDHVESAQTIYGSGTELLRLINDVLDLSKIEAGRMEVYMEEIPLEGFFRDMERYFRPLAADKKISLQVIVAEGLPASIYTDKQKTEQILKNFVSNAIKFTEQGSITLAIDRPKNKAYLEKIGFEPEKCVAFSVTDTGIGIPKEKQELIFEAFQQADGSISRKHGGTGLGLSISRRLSKMIGGEIHLQSTPGKGSAFTLYLPERFEQGALRADGEPPPGETVPAPSSAGIEKMPAGTPASSTLPLPVYHPGSHSRQKAESDSGIKFSEAPLKDKKILIVDDDMRNAFSLKKVLKNAGMKVLIGKSGKQGIERLNKNPDIHIVLMDIIMSQMDGYQTIRKIRTQEKFKQLPIISLTARAMEGDRAKCIEAGADDYLAKPVRLDQLFSTLTHWLK